MRAVGHTAGLSVPRLSQSTHPFLFSNTNHTQTHKTVSKGVILEEIKNESQAGRDVLA